MERTCLSSVEYTYILVQITFRHARDLQPLSHRHVRWLASMKRRADVLLAIAAHHQVNNICLPVYLPTCLTCGFIDGIHLPTVISAYNTCIYLTPFLSLSESALFHTQTRKKRSFSCKEVIELKERKDEGEEMHTIKRKRCSQRAYSDRSREGKSVKERVWSVRQSEIE